MNPPRMPRISPERKLAYYSGHSGLTLTGIGVLLFLSTFVSMIVNFGDFHDGVSPVERFDFMGTIWKAGRSRT